MQPADVLRALRGRPGLVGLVGEWCGGGAVIACEPSKVLGPAADPFAVLDEVGTGPAEPLSFGGGWIGLWGYQEGRRLERLPVPPERPLPQPDHWLGWYDWVLRQDSEGAWWFESLLPEEQARACFDHTASGLTAAGDHGQAFRFGAFGITPSPEEHMAAVARAIEHIRAGDIFQANVCARLEAAFEGSALDAFCAGIAQLTPAYAAFLDTGDRQVASFSPELFLRRTGSDVRTAPIKGTLPLEAGADALAASAKDRAENVMIVDLMRNDLGRVCRSGSIAVPALAHAEQRAGVWHLVSEVTGELREGMTDADLLRATFPPGSVTGAPKIRAMELIAELETTGRELYTGVIGYASPEAGLETSVVIRTLEFAEDRVWLGVGGGVVADSLPGAELEECLTKARPVLAAVSARLEPELAERDAPVRPAGLPRVPPDRTGAMRPDPRQGVFTTLLVRDGTAVRAAEHARRVVTSAHDALGLQLDPDALVDTMSQRASGLLGLHPMRVMVSAAGEVSVSTQPAPLDVDSPRRLVASLVAGGLGGHKWQDRRVLEHLVADGGDPELEPLLLDLDGTVLETGRANVFLVMEDGVHTPRADGRILPGVTRAAVLDLLARHCIPVHERDIALTDLALASEVFTTSSVRGVVPVLSCADVASWPPGPTTAWLRAAMERDSQPLRVVDQRSAARPDGDPARARVLLVDNYDSFAYNLAQYAEELGASVSVIRNDEETAEEVVDAALRGDFTHLVISPGPGRPEDAGMSVELVRRLGGRVPVLGVCLGHQCIATAYGAEVARARTPVHGKQGLVHHDGTGLFRGIDGPFVAGRYHSVVVTRLDPDLRLSAWTADGTVMGIRHWRDPVEGIQVHPESILTPRGHRLLRNYLSVRARRSQFSNL